MKRMKIFGIIAVTATLFISGCNSVKPAATDNSQVAPVNQAQGGNNGGNGGNRGQNQNPDVYGEVTAVNGNDVDLKILVAQNFGGNMQGGQGGPRGQGGRNGGNPNRKNGQNPDGVTNPSDTANPNDVQNPNGQNDQRTPDTRPSPGPRPSSGPRPTPAYTGATEKVSLAEGVQIFSMQRQNRGDNQNSGFGNNQQTIAVKDIKVGDVVSIWYSDKDKKVISRVMVRPGSQQ